MIIKRVTFLFLRIITSQLLTGCSFYADFFIINSTDKKVTAIITWAMPIDSLLKRKDHIQMMSTDSILRIDDSTAQYLTKQLLYTKLDSITLSVNLAPNSTTLIGGAIGKPLHAQSVSIIKGNEKITDVLEKLRKKGGMMPPFHFLYKVQ